MKNSLALDPTRYNIITLLKDLSEQNNAILIIVTHDKRLKDKFKNHIELYAS